MDSDAGSPVKNLAPALVQTFSIILLGYFVGSSPTYPSGARLGIDLFVADVTLPSIFYMGLSQLDFQNVDWTFFNAVLLSKLCVFFLVALYTFLLEPRGGEMSLCSLAGIRGLFVTLQNDFALGIPLFEALYR